MERRAKKLYVKLPSGNWIRVKGKLSSSSSRAPRRAVYVLLAELVDEPEVVEEKPLKEFYISSTRATKYIHKLVESMDDEACIVIEFIRPEVYRVAVYSDKKDVAHGIAIEMGITRKS